MPTPDPTTGFTLDEMKSFVRNHFEEFVNRQNLDIAFTNFAPEFIDHGSDVPPGTPPGPAGARQYVASAMQHFPDIHVTLEGPHRRSRQSRRPQHLARHRPRLWRQTPVRRHCHLAHRPPSARRALGLPRKTPSRPLGHSPPSIHHEIGP